jgi:transketolase
MKTLLGLPLEPFAFDDSVIERTRVSMSDRARVIRTEWNARFEAWSSENPQNVALLERVSSGALPSDLEIPRFESGKMSTRKASGKVINALKDQLPELWGGSADLAGSNNTTLEGELSFLPRDRTTQEWPGGPYGRVLHFGIREHAMGGILNGIILSGLTRPFGGTFFVFSDYVRPAVRLAALMRIGSIFVWTHDSIGVGEDGPTHQPVEHLASYRAIPGLDIVRPADANETAVVWRQILSHADRPTGLVLSRQDLLTVDRDDPAFGSAEGAARGAYVIREARGPVQLILIATGSEVQLVLQAQNELQELGVGTRVVSMPCQEWFDAQDDEYKNSILLTDVPARVSVEAGLTLGWSRYVGPTGASIGLDHYGESAPGGRLMEKYGFTGRHVVEVAREVLANC